MVNVITLALKWQQMEQYHSQLDRVTTHKIQSTKWNREHTATATASIAATATATATATASIAAIATLLLLLHYPLV